MALLHFCTNCHELAKDNVLRLFFNEKDQIELCRTCMNCLLEDRVDEYHRRWVRRAVEIALERKER